MSEISPKRRIIFLPIISEVRFVANDNSCSLYFNITLHVNSSAKQLHKKIVGDTLVFFIIIYSCVQIHKCLQQLLAKFFLMTQYMVLNSPTFVHILVDIFTFDL